MADILGKDYENTTVEIDGNRYTQCSFKNCKLTYRGGDIPLFEGCKLEFCTWNWDDAALRTIGYLRGIYSGLGPMGAKIVDDIFKHIQTPYGAN